MWHLRFVEVGRVDSCSQIRQTFEAVPSVPIFQRQRLDLKSILTVAYQLGKGLDPSRLPRDPNL